MNFSIELVYQGLFSDLANQDVVCQINYDTNAKRNVFKKQKT